MRALQDLAAEDPTFTVGFDHETDQTVISGMGELHLEILADRVQREFKVPCAMAPPQAAYQETATRRARAEGRYIHQTGGSGHYAVVQLALVPGERGSGFVLENRAPPLEIPPAFERAIEHGIQGAMEEGPLAAYPVVDVQVVLTGGRVHEVDSHSRDFEIAASMAFKRAYQRAHPILLEPVMAVTTRVPDAYVGPAVADISARGGRVSQMQLMVAAGGIRDRGHRTVESNVRLRDGAAFPDQRARTIHDGLRALCAGARGPGGGDHRGPPGAGAAHAVAGPRHQERCRPPLNDSLRGGRFLPR